MTTTIRAKFPELVGWCARDLFPDGEIHRSDEKPTSEAALLAIEEWVQSGRTMKALAVLAGIPPRRVRLIHNQRPGRIELFESNAIIDAVEERNGRV